MTVWELLIATATIVGALVTVFLLFALVRRNPIRDAQQLADAFTSVEAMPEEFRPLARSRLLEAAAAKFFSTPMIGWVLGFVLLLIIISMIGILSTASEAVQSTSALLVIVTYLVLILYVTKTQEYRQRTRTHLLLLAQSRAELKTYIDQYQEVDTRSLDERKVEEITRKFFDWIRTTKGAKEAILIIILALLIVSMIGMATDFGWI